MLSPVDTAVICGLALLLFGPKKFPEIGRALGQGLGNFKKALTDAQHEFKDAAKIEETKVEEKEKGLEEKGSLPSETKKSVEEIKTGPTDV